jgi:6-phosphofructokinase 1
MNSAVRFATRLCLSQGHVPLHVFDGVKGLLEGRIVVGTSVSVSSWGHQGGAYLNPTRHTISAAEMPKLAEIVKREKINGILMIGGFEGYLTMHTIHKHKRECELELSLGCVPATISVNVPATDTSIGLDRALTNLVEAGDRILESASGMKRLFILDVMGKFCGALALLGGLACGADLVYIHEKPYFPRFRFELFVDFCRITVHSIDQDASNLRKRFDASV